MRATSRAADRKTNALEVEEVSTSTSTDGSEFCMNDPWQDQESENL